jgi:hypothetical protein
VDFVAVYTQTPYFQKHVLSPLSGKGEPKLRGPIERILPEELPASIYRLEQSSTLKMVVTDSFERSVPFY